MFQLHVYDSLYSQALAFSQVPSGIALIIIESIDATVQHHSNNKSLHQVQSYFHTFACYPILLMCHLNENKSNFNNSMRIYQKYIQLFMYITIVICTLCICIMLVSILQNIFFSS